MKNFISVSSWFAGYFSRIFREYFWFILLGLILIFFFIINFGYGRFYAFTDISNIELHPWQEFLKRFSMWQEYRGFGIELGTEAGYAVPLLFFSFLSTIGFSALQINFTINLFLFVLPALSVSVLAFAIFYRDYRRNFIAFFAGLLFATSFVFYIRILSPLFLQVWPWIMSALITAFVLLLLQTGKKRFWVVLLALFYLNLGSFIGLPSAVAPLAFGGLYILYYLLVESKNKRRDFLRVLIACLFFVLVSLPLFWSLVHLVFSASFQAAASAKSYTWTVFTLNLDGRDFSQLTYGFRLIGTCNWNMVLQMPGFVGRLGYPYSALFTSNILFALSSFLLPLVAFGSLLFKESPLLRRRLLFLGLLSVLFLFVMKGVREPLGDIFLWSMTHISPFSIFRTPYDKIAPALGYSLCISGAYTFSRIVPSLNKISIAKFLNIKKSFGTNSFSSLLPSLRKKSVIKKIIAFILLAALIIDAYPAYSGQLLNPIGFFNVPPYYQQLADYVKSDLASYKILGLPSVEYTNRYSWGYFGITFDGVNLDKPVLERSNTGSDLFGDRIITSLQDEVLFRSDLPVAPVGGKPIFTDNTTPNATINLDRVMYYGYMLQKSNVGQLILRHDMAGGYAYTLNAVDWQRYNDLFNSLNSLGFIGEGRTFGNVTIYNINNYMPLIYANSPVDVYNINNYDTILGSAFVNSRMAIMASLNNCTTSLDYVSNGTNIGGKEIYVPIIADQYYYQIQSDLISESQYTVTPNLALISQLNETFQQLGKIVSNDRKSIYYLDSIQNSGLFDIYLKLDNSTMKADENTNIFLNKEIVFGNQKVAINEHSSVGNGWFKVGNVHLNPGNLLMHTNIAPALQLAFPDGSTENDLPSSIVVWNTTVRRLDSGWWKVDISSGNWNYTYSNLEDLLSTSDLDANFRSDIAKTLHVVVIKTDLDIALVSSGISENNSQAPSLVFGQIQPGKLLVNIKNASDSFFLNFLESYQAGWKLYVVPTKTLGNDLPVRDYAGSVELQQGHSFLPDSYDFNMLLSKSVLDNQHLLLNGFANSWYVNINDLANQHVITPDSNGTYDFTLLLYFTPQTNFVLGLSVSIITGALVCVVLCVLTVRVWKRSKAEKRVKSA